MRIVVAGAGIGGLSVAKALSMAEHDVVLLERAPQLKPVGAGISLQPNAMQALHELGLSDAVSAAAYPAETAQVLRQDGKPIQQLEFANYVSRYGFLPYTIYRPELIRVLYESLAHDKVEILLDESFEDYETDGDGVCVFTAKGKRIQADALIGADGIKSRVAKKLWGAIPINNAGYTCWRGVVSEPALVDRVKMITEVWGRGARFGFMKCSANLVYWFATMDNRIHAKIPSGQSWTRHFDSWVSPVSDLIAATEVNEIIHGDIIDRDPISPWGKGPVTLLGDAAHAMTPNFGQGGAQAMEDAVILGRVFSNPNSIDANFRSYEKIREPRTRKLVLSSRQFGKIGQGGNMFRRAIRNFVLPKLPKSFVDAQLHIQFDFKSLLAQTDLV